MYCFTGVWWSMVEYDVWSDAWNEGCMDANKHILICNVWWWVCTPIVRLTA